jgi:hypothetical protein
MADATVKRIDEMESFYEGMVVRARAELGVTSWGMQVFHFPAGFDQYPNHHHGEGAVDPGQEELYIPLSGSGELLLNGERHTIEPESGRGSGSRSSGRSCPETRACTASSSAALQGGRSCRRHGRSSGPHLRRCRTRLSR